MASTMTDIVADLRQALGPDLVSVGEDIPVRNRRDWSTPAPVKPLALVRPRQTSEVAVAVRLCHAAGVPVVPQGGMTGLCGGATPIAKGVAISLERMTGIEEIDLATATATVRAGTPLEAIQDAVDTAGFLLPLDLGARGSCAIGGNISTNAGGNRVVRYGMTRDMILGLEVVLPDGTVLNSLNKLVKNNTGYDLKQLFIGAEGTLGIVTRAVVKLQPKPAFFTAAVCGLPDFAAVVRLLQGARAGLGGTLSAFEVMWPDFYELMTTKAPGVRTPLVGRHGRYVLLEAQGADEAFENPRFEAFLERMLEAGIIEDAAVARSAADVRAFWGLRDAVSEFDHILGPSTGFDVSLPTGEMDEFVAEVSSATADRFPAKEQVSFGHVGDGNIHMVFHVPGLEPQPKAEIQEIVYGIVRRRHGSISAEHGIGLLRRPYIGHTRSPEELALMRTIKAAIDPTNIMNPGRILAE